MATGQKVPVTTSNTSLVVVESEGRVWQALIGTHGQSPTGRGPCRSSSVVRPRLDTHEGQSLAFQVKRLMVPRFLTAGRRVAAARRNPDRAKGAGSKDDGHRAQRASRRRRQPSRANLLPEGTSGGQGLDELVEDSHHLGARSVALCGFGDV
jgi:hypothetical protein